MRSEDTQKALVKAANLYARAWCVFAVAAGMTEDLEGYYAEELAHFRGEWRALKSIAFRANYAAERYLEAVEKEYEE